MSGLHLTRRGALGLAMAAGFAALLKPLRARAADTVAVRRGYAKGRFGQLHYRIAKPESAAAPPLLCLHSSPNSGRTYETFLGAMGTDRVAVAADTPGFGDSDPPPEAPGIADYAAAMGDLIDTMGFETVDVIGYHTGAMTSVELALQRPEQVRRVIMISAPVYTDQELKEARDRFGPETLTRDGSHLAKKWATHVYWAMPGWSLDHVATQFPDALRRPAISWWGHYAAFGYPLADKLPQVRQPVLVLNPADDLHEKTLRARALIANGEFRELPGWGHGFLDIRTKEAAGIVRDFLAAGA